MNRIRRTIGKTALAGLLAAMLGGLGCGSGLNLLKSKEAGYIKPRIAVLRFEDLSRNSKWKTGEGFADELTDRLIRTGRYTVLRREQADRFLPQGRTNSRKTDSQWNRNQPGHFNNVEYVITGRITDFGHIGKDTSLKSVLDWENWGGGTTKSIVGLTLYVTEAKTGRIITCKPLEAWAADGKNENMDRYKVMAFGSVAFYDSPMGKATARALNRTVAAVHDTIRRQSYQPKIASLINEQIIINGGALRGVRVGDEYFVRSVSRQVLDPDSGLELGQVSGQTVGRVRVVQVTEKYAIAEVVEGGGFAANQTLFAADDPSTAQGPVAIGAY